MLKFETIGFDFAQSLTFDRDVCNAAGYVKQDIITFV